MEFEPFTIEVDYQGTPYISILEEYENTKIKI